MLVIEKADASTLGSSVERDRRPQAFLEGCGIAPESTRELSHIHEIGMILLEAHFLELANVRPQEAENRMRGRTPNERSGHDQESAQGARWRVRHMPVPIIFGHRRGLRYRYERVADRSRLFTRILIRLLGVGDLIATGNVLTVEDPHRFRKSRDAGCFVGLQPGRRNSGESETTDAHQQRGGRVSTDAAGARSELHFRTLWRRQ